MFSAWSAKRVLLEPDAGKVCCRFRRAGDVAEVVFRRWLTPVALVCLRQLVFEMCATRPHKNQDMFLATSCHRCCTCRCQRFGGCWPLEQCDQSVSSRAL